MAVWDLPFLVVSGKGRRLGGWVRLAPPRGGFGFQGNEQAQPAEIAATAGVGTLTVANERNKRCADNAGLDDQLRRYFGQFSYLAMKATRQTGRRRLKSPVNPSKAWLNFDPELAILASDGFGLPLQSERFLSTPRAPRRGRTGNHDFASSLMRLRCVLDAARLRTSLG